MHQTAPRGETQVITADRLGRFARLIFEKLGMAAADARLLAEHLIWADLRGISWLGVKKIPQYVERLRAGGTSARAEPVITSESATLVAFAGGDAFGQVVGVHAMRAAIERARSAGIGAAVVRDTTSAGALGYFAMLAARERMIGLAINNAPPLMPAPGGTEKILGNQAFAIAAPAARHDPLLLDMATSAITLARIHEYEHRGEPLPEGVALDARGEPTTDPAAALAGILLPTGEHRGFGLALMWEVLTGVLAGGARFSRDVTMPDRHDRPQAVSMFLLAIDPESVMPYADFVARVDEMIDRIHATRPAAGHDRVTVPGERGHRMAADRRRHGIPVPDDLAAALAGLGRELGVPWV
jgi:LDH2 family malate/lactate/ureidoglycolate dehydrogenase